VGNSLDDGLIRRVERGRERHVRHPVRSQPHIVFTGPRLPARIDESVPQQQFRQPVPRGHQILSGVLAGTDQIPGSFFGDRRDMHDRDLAQLEQACQMGSVPASVFTLQESCDQSRQLEYIMTVLPVI